MSDHTTFIAKCLAGEVLLDEINDHIREWQKARSGQPVWTYLGMTKSEYGAWLEEPTTLRWIVSAYKNGEAFSTEAVTHAIAARSASPEEAQVLNEWLRRTKRL